MAGRHVPSSSLIFYLIACLFTAHWKEHYSTSFVNDDLQTFVISFGSLQPKIVRLAQTSNSSIKGSKMATAQRAILFLRYVNIALSANLLLLSNDIALNPGPSQMPNMRGLRIFHLNVCSLRNKMDEVRVFCDTHKPHIFSLNETWLDETFTDSDVLLPGYNIVRRDRNRHGGGILVFVADHLNFNRLNEPIKVQDIEAIWIEIQQPQSSKLLIGAIYRPPKYDYTDFISALENHLTNFTTNAKSDIILLGDFNIDLNSPNGGTKHFKQFTKSYQLKQIITTPTRITETSKTLIDLFFTSRPEHYISGVIPVGFSDHSAIFAVRKLHRIKSPAPKFIESRNYKHFNLDEFQTDLSHIPWEIIESKDTPDDAWSSFKDLFLTAADKHAPITKRRVRGKSLPWITNDIKSLMQDRDWHHKKAIKTNKEIHWSTYKRLRNKVTKKMREEKSKYYTDKLSNEKDAKEMWKILNEIIPKRPKSTGTISSLTADKFNQFFTSVATTLCSRFQNSLLPQLKTNRVDQNFSIDKVTVDFVRKELQNLKSSKAAGLDKIPAKLLKCGAYQIAKPIAFIINLTITSGSIPNEWKEAKVVPIYKSGKKDDTNNYRPISVLPLISKVMERAVQIQLVAFLTENNILSMHQSGFRKKHSTQTTITYLADCILDNMDNQKMTGAVFIDLKKAFDLVDHTCLLHKLDHYGVRGHAKMWFESYLKFRSQKVKYGDNLSSSNSMTYSVPQGSILGPLLFVIYINDLPEALTKSEISMYADDTVIYYSDTNVNAITKTLQDDLNKVVKWLHSSRLILNQRKTKCMLFGTQQKLASCSDFNIDIGGKSIDKVTKFDYLGVTLDEKLSWKEHVNSISDKVNKRLGLLSRIRSYVTLNAAKCVYNSVIHPIFSYADTAWGELSQTCSDSLQRLHNRAARIIIKRNSSEEAKCILGWFDLETHRKVSKCILVHKCLNGQIPDYFDNYFNRNCNFHNYNTRRKTDIHMTKANLSLGKRSFKFSGARLYNSLSSEIKKISNINSFKNRVKKFFYTN